MSPHRGQRDTPYVHPTPYTDPRSVDPVPFVVGRLRLDTQQKGLSPSEVFLTLLREVVFRPRMPGRSFVPLPLPEVQGRATRFPMSQDPRGSWTCLWGRPCPRNLRDPRTCFQGPPYPRTPEVQGRVHGVYHVQRPQRFRDMFAGPSCPRTTETQVTCVGPPRFRTLHDGKSPPEGPRSEGRD